MPCQVQVFLKRGGKDSLDDRMIIKLKARAKKEKTECLGHHRHATDVVEDTQHVTADSRMKSVIPAPKLDT